MDGLRIDHFRSGASQSGYQEHAALQLFEDEASSDAVFFGAEKTTILAVPVAQWMPPTRVILDSHRVGIRAHPVLSQSHDNRSCIAAQGSTSAHFFASLGTHRSGHQRCTSH